MAVLTALAIAGAGLAAYGTYKSYKSQKKAAAAQQQQQKNERRRSTQQALRQAQIQRAASVASAGGAGVADSSGVSGGVASISSRAGEAIGFAGTQSALSGIVTKQNQRAQMFSGLASIGGAAFNFGASMGGLDHLKKNYGTTPDFTDE